MVDNYWYIYIWISEWATAINETIIMEKYCFEQVYYKSYVMYFLLSISLLAKKIISDRLSAQNTIKIIKYVNTRIAIGLVDGF